MPRRKPPAYECSFCGDELDGAWMFPLHHCEPMAQLEVVISRVLRSVLGQAHQHAHAHPQASPEDAARAQLRRAAETIARAAGLPDVNWDVVLQYPEDFKRAWRAARSAAHPDRPQGNEELFKLVNQAADAIKSAFREKGIAL